ncbi:MAG: hypothetical protein ABL997_20645, partial [Planctomycetota bacterium]
ATMVAVLAAAVLGSVGHAQDLLPKGAPETRAIVLQNAIVHTMDRGTLIGGTVWFQDGVIRGVLSPGDKLKLPEGTEAVWIDATQKHVYPGLVAAHSQLGLIELGSVRQTVDTDELNDQSPEAIAGVAVNPDSAAIPVARSNGVLAACVFPIGGELPGRASVMQLDGWTNADMTVLGDAGVVVDWPSLPEPRGRRGRGMRPPSPAGTPPAAEERDPEAATRKARERIEETFVRAKNWLAQKAASATTPPDLQCEALAAAVRGEKPVFVLADDLEEIESALSFTAARGLRTVIVGGRDALLCKDLLRERDVPVILTGVHKLPPRDDSDYDTAFVLPSKLAAAGIRFCIATGEEFAHERNLPYHAATAAAFGLDRDRAMAAITRDAAEILGVGNMLGTLTVGKHATLLVTDGNPLDLTTKVERAFVAGREVDLRNKQTELAKKYRQKYAQLPAAK